MIRAVVILEGEFHELVEFETEQEMAAFSKGVDTGAGGYGGGCWDVITEPDLLRNEVDSAFPDARVIAMKHFAGEDEREA